MWKKGIGKKRKLWVKVNKKTKLCTNYPQYVNK